MDPWTAFALGLFIGIILALIVGTIIWQLLSIDLDETLAHMYRLELRAEAWRQIAMVYRDELPDMADTFSKRVTEIRRVK